MCQKPISRTGHVFEEYAQGKRWNTGDLISDGVSLSYTSGLDCCDACIALNTDYKWASVGVEGTDMEGRCYCKVPPFLPNLPIETVESPDPRGPVCLLASTGQCSVLINCLS